MLYNVRAEGNIRVMMSFPAVRLYQRTLAHLRQIKWETDMFTQFAQDL